MNGNCIEEELFMELKRWLKAGVPFMALLLANPVAQAADLSLQEAIIGGRH